MNKKPIKPILGFVKVAPTEVLARANAVYAGIKENPTDFPAPTIDLAAFKGEIESLSSKITAALDGGRKSIAERNHQAQVVIRMLRQLGHYVEATCKDDMTIFLKSGFEAASASKTTSQALSQFIRQIRHGDNTGQVRVTIAADAGAFSYELRWAALGAGGAPGAWAAQPVSKTRPAALVAGLTPGVTYAFQVRSLGDSGYSDWSDSVTRICM
jgi:hypothetical protein